MAFADDVLPALLDALDSGVHITDREGRTVYYNEAAGRLDGLSPREVVGRHVLEVFPSLTRETSTLLRVLATRRPIVSQTQTFTNFKGVRVTTVNSTWPIVRDGELIGALEISRDVTRVRELTERIVDLEAALYRPRRRSGGRARVERPDVPYTFDDLTGDDPAFLEAVQRARRAALSASPVFVYGETGTGKELLCQAIHNAGSRRDKAFIAQNCAALPEALLEGILFGTVRGAFTGAEDRPGLLELADGGTVLLDEINSMPTEIQAKLLRVVEDGRIRRLGETRERDLDVRIIASSNEDPWGAVTAGRLREDLYYRLNVISIRLPALRERPGDIPTLAELFLRKHAPRVNPEVRLISAELMELFRRYAWPGNVRELEHAIEGALNVADGPSLEPRHVDPRIVRSVGRASAEPPENAAENPAPPLAIRREAYLADERAEIERALAQAGGSVTSAARRLGIPRQTLQYRMKRLGIAPRPR